jgi:predicted transcriptional regulator
MMERLRLKRRLRRRQVDGIYLYASTASSGEVLRGAVHRFVETTLSGSVSPFVAYLAESSGLSDPEIRELEALVARLRTPKKED